jgi:NADH:ubiquinone oxidoreductase subunit B-like Fe-S oxidoreductase
MIHNESTDSYDLQIAFTFNNKVNSIKVDRIRSDTTENGLWFYSYATSVALTEQYTLESLRFDLRFDSFTPILAFQEIKKKV